MLDRIRELGFDSVTHFLSQFPGEPYVTVVNHLGDDFVALQIMRMQIEEATSEKAIERLAMDAIVRELNYQLPCGWGSGSNVDFHTSGAFVDWLVRLKRELSHDVEAKARSVWHALKELSPPIGWSPRGPDDDVIVRAFQIGWEGKKS